MNTIIPTTNNDQDGDVVVEKKCKDGVGSATKHPLGMKRAKQMKKEDEMVDRLSQKFGITSNKTTNDKETTQMKTMTKNSPALQEALVEFLSITGQGMSAWMMQSMSNSSSDEIKKEYANEMMKQQILKICHDNAKMMKELTEMKSLSSSVKEEHNECKEDMYTYHPPPPPPPHLIDVSFCKLLFMAIAVLSEQGQ